jgi:hypothetical protein
MPHVCVFQLPHNSGLSIIDMETDETMQHSMETLIQVAQHRLDFFAWSLSEMLQKMIKVHNLISDGRLSCLAHFYT